MDFGDLIFLIFIALGGLSSILGGKKKKKTPAAPTRVQRPPRPTVAGRSKGVGTTPGRDLQDARQKVSNEMDRILRELGLGGASTTSPPPPTWVPPPSTPPIEQTEVSDEVEVDEVYERPMVPRSRSRPLTEREMPRSVSVETFERDNVSLETLERAGGRSHVRFHDRYIKPLEETPVHREPPRARKFVNPQSLREAILVKEILGPPKGLQ